MVDKITDLKSLVDSMLVAAEEGRADDVAKLKEQFMFAGERITQNLLQEGYSMPEILSGAYLHNRPNEKSHQ